MKRLLILTLLVLLILSCAARQPNACAHGHGDCNRCELPWCAFEFEYHVTTYSPEGHGVFPLCDSCWSILTPRDRLPFYKKMVSDWHREAVVFGFWTPVYDRDLAAQWALIEIAVLEGR